MRLIKKSEKTNLLKAVSEVSGYSVNELMVKKNRTVAPWKKVAIYIARQEGFTFDAATDIFDQHISTGFQAVKHVKSNMEKLKPTIEEIQKRKQLYDSHEDDHELEDID